MKDTDPTTSPTMIEVPEEFKIPAQAEAPAVNPEMITVPDEIKKSLAEAADKLAAAQEAAKPQVIESMPGAPAGAYRSPEQVVEEINNQLASRDLSLGRPEIRAGDIVTQRGQ
jgi:hypothetical protein